MPFHVSLPDSSVCTLSAALLLALAVGQAPVAIADVPSAAVTTARTTATTTVDYASRLQEIVSKYSPGGTVGLHVVDGATSKVLFSMNAEEALKPASCNKLLTTAAGLSILGPDYRFVTSVFGRGTVTSGTLEGDLIVRGGGDPTISGRFEENKRDVTATFRRWADALKTAGIERITGDIIADGSFFDDEVYHPAWSGGERGEWYSAEVSGLSFNDNCVDLTWSAKDKLPGDRADFRMNPVTNYVQIDNQVKVLAQGRATERYYRRPATMNDILSIGSITVDVIKDDSAAVHDGALYAVSVFRDVLTSQGVAVDGRARKPDPTIDSTATVELVFEHPSLPLTEVVNIINRNSQNFYAEALLKTLGRVVRNEGSFAAGGATVQDFITSSGFYNSGHQMIDGSGLSSRNRVSPRQLVEVIQALDQGELRDAWRNSFPVGQTRGSLRTRFAQDDESKAVAPRIMGKTGTIGRVRALSGIIDRPTGDPLYYSILLNDYRIRDSQALEMIDELAVALAKD